MFQRLFAKYFALFGVSLLFVASACYLWHLQQPQAAPEVGAAALPLQCVSYAPYYKPGMNPTVAGNYVDPVQIEQDLKALSAITRCVRTYSVSQGLDYVPKAAQKLGMQVILGAWIGWLDKDNQTEIALAVERANTYQGTVKGLIIGNEVLLRGEQSEAKMREYLQMVKAQTRVPVTYADVWEFWLKHPALEQDVDQVTVHILPYWEDKPVPVALAVAHTASVMGHLGTVFKKPLLIGETGWPSQGRQRFGAVPSLVNEARYLRGFLQVAHTLGWQYNVIEAVDQPWKRELEGTVGGYWGLLDVDLQPKFALQGTVAERDDGLWPWGMSLVLVGLSWWWAGRKSLSYPTRALVSLGFASVGLHAYLQVEYVQFAARYVYEYAMLGGLMLVSVSLAVMQVRQLAGLALQINWERWLLVLFAFALLTTSAGLCVQGRYLNFPILLTLLPVMLSLLAVVTQRVAGHLTSTATSGVWALGVLLLLASQLAVSAAILESGNQMAWWWAGLCGLAALVLPVKWMLHAPCQHDSK